MSYNINKLGERIRSEREKINLSREKLAEMINISPSFLGLVERGDRKLSLEKICLVAEVFNKSIDSFIKEDDRSLFKDGAEGYVINSRNLYNKELEEIYELLKSLSEDELKYVNDNIQGFKRFLMESKLKNK